MLRPVIPGPVRTLTGPLAALVLLTACTGGAAAAGTASPSSATAAGSWSVGEASQDASGTGGCAATALAGMDLAERTGQLLMVGTSLDDPSDVAGTVTAESLGGVFLQGRSTASVAELAAEVDAIRQAAAVPLHVAVDQEGGAVLSLSGDGFPDLPTALEQGGWATSRLSAEAAATATALASAGVTLNLAPVADTVAAADADDNPPIGAYDREYGNTPEDVSAAVTTVVTASQAAGVLTTLKHFPGLGRVDTNTDEAAGAEDAAVTADDAYLQPFRDGIAAGAAAVMVSSASYPALDDGSLAVFSEAVVTGLLRGDLGFTGLVVSDDLGAAGAVADVPVGSRATGFVAAGGDLVLTVERSDAATMHDALTDRAGSDEAFRAQVDAAALRVLQSKVDAGLPVCG